VDKAAGGAIALSWDGSCSASDSDFEIYEGQLGDFGSHSPRTCSTGGATTAEITPSSGGRYYLVVPRSADHEGSYGVDGQASERAASAQACVPQQFASCAP
jgi:hypothetical protein